MSSFYNPPPIKKPLKHNKKSYTYYEKHELENRVSNDDNKDLKHKHHYFKRKYKGDLNSLERILFQRTADIIIDNE